MTATLPTWTTEHVPPRTGEVLPESLPGRPHDADSLQAFLTFAHGAVWPDGGGAEQLVVLARLVKGWAGGNGAIGSKGYSLRYRHAQYGANERDHSADEWSFYAPAMAWWPLTVAAAASAVVRVDESPGSEPHEYGIRDLYLASGAPVELESLRRISEHPDLTDTPDLWLWVAARSGGPGPQSEKKSGPLLPGALATAQAMWDIASLYIDLAQQVPDEPATTTESTRRDRWH